MIAFMQTHSSLMNALVASGGILAAGVTVSLWERYDQWRNR